MKQSMIFAIFVFGGLSLAACASKSSLDLRSVTTKADANPVSRVVSLLNGLKGKLEEELKSETDLFETYKCWYKSTKMTKKASNEAANSRIDSLKSYIKDIEAGKIEFTTERQDLEKQIAGLTKQMTIAKTMRDNENKDYLAAKAEMDAAIAALDKAIKIIEDATKGSFAQVKSYTDLLSLRHSVQKAMLFSRDVLDASDKEYLDRLIANDVPKHDWKKLNRKATFKMKYNRRSNKIIDTLKSLSGTFTANRATAVEQEQEAAATYEKLKKSKQGMLDSAKQALTDMAEENGARGVSKTDAQNEVDALQAQVKADTKFINEATVAFNTKEKEWDARKELRGKEILAMSQAIAVLASDDAKDQFKESFKSQGYMLLQLVQAEPKYRVECAARAISALASKSSDPRLALLARQAGNAAIDKVIKKIDDIVSMITTEEKDDLDKKQKCEGDLSDAASKAKKAAQEMDTATEDITRASSKVAELKVQIEEQQAKSASLKSQIKDMEDERKKENAQFKADKLADEKAVQLIEQAVKIIKDWKNAKKAALISETEKISSPISMANAVHTPEAVPPLPQATVSKHLSTPALLAAQAEGPKRYAGVAIGVHTVQHSSRQDPQYVVAAGKAPPPPPATWNTADYKGATGEQTGIVAILDLVKADIKKDTQKSEEEEAQSVKDFNKEKSDLEGEIKAVAAAVSAYQKDKAAQEQIVTDKTSERSTKKGELDSHIALYKSYKPGCDFLLINFNMRTKARQIEIDGLQKAKAILQGADFGSSLLQMKC